MKYDPTFERWYHNYNDPIRIIAWRCTNVEPMKILENEIELNTRADKMLEEERFEFDRASEEVTIARGKRVKVVGESRCIWGSSSES